MIITMMLPKVHREEIVAWLHQHVEANHSADRQKPLAPWYVSTVARTVTWRGITQAWTVKMSAKHPKLLVTMPQDMATLMALKFS